MPEFNRQRLAEARRSASLSYEHLAVAAGVSVATVRRWETGYVPTVPDVDQAAAIADVLGIRLDDLVVRP